MSTKYLMKKLPSCLLGAILAAGIASSTMVNAVDGDPPGLFELEGNPEGEAAAGDDWEDLYNFGGNDGGSPFAFTGIVPDIATADVGDRVFTQGGSKDVSDVDQWKYTTGSTPDKNEITNAYAAAYTMPVDTGPHKAGDLIVYFGLDRFANDGDALAGFWFFQGEVSQTEPSVQGTGDFIGNHVAMRDNPDFGLPGEPEFLPGDMFIIVNYPQGANAEPEIKVYQWDPNDADGDKNFDSSEQTKPPKNLSSPLDLVFADAQALCDGTGDKLACAVTNPADIVDSPEWEYTPKSGLATTLPHESLFEGGINVSALLGTTPCFAAFLAETRSSTSQTAQLKDYVFGAFPVCGIEVTKECDADLNETGTAVVVNFSGTLTNTGGSSYTAYLADDMSGSSITDVCVDEGEPGCADDDEVPELVMTGGYAYFPLGAGEVVTYEGQYTTAGLPSNFTQSDEVTALAFADEDDLQAFLQLDPDDPDYEAQVDALAVVDDTDPASCTYSITPSLDVVKECSIAFIDGDHADVTISGTVKNTGNVQLSGLTASDNPHGAVILSKTSLAAVTFDDDDNPIYDEATFTKTINNVPLESLGPTYLSEGGLVTVTLNESDTVTAIGKVLDGSGNQLGANVTDTGSDTCSQTFTRGIDIQKDCVDVVLEPLSDEDPRLVVKAKVTVTVTNTGDEDLQNIVLTDNPAVVFESYSSTLAGGQTPDASFTVDGYYYPTSGAVLDDPTNLSFPDTATVNASGVFSLVGGGATSDSDGADCPLCPAPVPE